MSVRDSHYQQEPIRTRCKEHRVQFYGFFFLWPKYMFTQSVAITGWQKFFMSLQQLLIHMSDICCNVMMLACPVTECLLGGCCCLLVA